MDIIESYKAAQSKKGSIYDVFYKSQLEQERVNFIRSNEYFDFIEFLQNELGFEEVEELQRKFDKQQECGG